jgi:hypothetical protein
LGLGSVGLIGVESAVARAGTSISINHLSLAAPTEDEILDIPLLSRNTTVFLLHRIHKKGTAPSTESVPFL